MFCLEYVEGWADVVTGRLLASHKSDILTEWAYSCICIGEGFDGYIVKNYRTVSEILGGFPAYLYSHATIQRGD